MAPVGVVDAAFLARAASGRPDVDVEQWCLEPAGIALNMTTHALDRASGTLVGGGTWSAFAKTLRPASSAPGWAHIPLAFRDSVLEDLNWLDEPRLYGCGLADQLPDGLRMPRIFRIDERPSLLTIWMEDIADRSIWDLARYRQSAMALGRLAADWPEARAQKELGVGRRPIRRLFAGKIAHLDMVVQADDAFWGAPSIATVAGPDHRRDLDRLFVSMPSLLDEVERLPHSMAHGDAAPANLLDPGDGSIVAIDWSYGSVAPMGSDLGQLLAGQVECGVADASDLRDIAVTIVDGYLGGVADGGGQTDRAAVEHAFATYLAVRSVFSQLLAVRPPGVSEEEAHRQLAARAALARLGLDMAADVLEGRPLDL
jgi:hypothetical protein